MARRAFLPIAFLLMFFFTAATACQAASLNAVKSKFLDLWAKTNDMTGKLSLFFNYSDRCAATFKDLDVHQEGAHWYYIAFDYTFKKPSMNHFRMNVARNLGRDYASILLEKNPGTYLVTGWDPEKKAPSDNKDVVFVRPNPKDPNDPSMKELAKWVYPTPGDVNQSWLGEVTFIDNLNAIFMRVFKGFDPARTEIAPDPGFQFKINLKADKTFKAQWKTQTYGGQTLKITHRPADPSKKHWIDKEIAWVDAKTYLPLQYEAWEGDVLAACFAAFDVKRNVGVKDDLWKKAFEGVEIKTGGGLGGFGQ